jgi:hypothetical protein
VHATAADVHSRTKDVERAKKSRELSRTTILKLANSLSSEEALQKSPGKQLRLQVSVTPQ